MTSQDATRGENGGETTRRRDSFFDPEMRTIRELAVAVALTVDEVGDNVHGLAHALHAQIIAEALASGAQDENVALAGFVGVASRCTVELARLLAEATSQPVRTVLLRALLPEGPRNRAEW